MKKTVLITGVAGFLGSHLCDYFLSKNFKVLGLDNLITGSPKNLSHLTSNSDFEFYNIFREKSTIIHAKNQQKMSHKYDINKEIINFKSKISFDAEIYNQIFNTEIWSPNRHTLVLGVVSGLPCEFYEKHKNPRSSHI